MLMWIHPTVQVLAVGLSLSVLRLGWVRFSHAHLGRGDLVFDWATHARQGTAVLTTWALALAFGFCATWWSWGKVFVTGRHHQTALVMLPLICFGLGSGLFMDRVKAKRLALPLAHGCANALLVLLALYQVYTGLLVLRDMVLD